MIMVLKVEAMIDGDYDEDNNVDNKDDDNDETDDRNTWIRAGSFKAKSTNAD